MNDLYHSPDPDQQQPPQPYGTDPWAQQNPQAVPPQVIVVHNSGPPSSVYSIVGLIMSILGLVTVCCTFGVFSLAAIICGHVGLIETRNNAKSGRGLAIASLVMGYLGIVPAVFLSIESVTGILIIPTSTPTTGP